ncbi:glycine zipper family protein [Enterobacter bugandensis]|uniref:glycine zipper family protein n=1 Tax=Enterobacter bugandensis TaxID=881260 RepID=UPI001C5BDCF6|nr:glycine zipper family protein [Enterobacter bugandensis]MBW4192280.1 glycine zipper family protein [Enterobacter bugandensis]
MSEYSTVTNENKNSTYDVTCSLMPARAFFFIIVDEPGKDGFLVRKIYASPSNPYLSKMNLTPFRMLSETDPERYGLVPKDFNSLTTVAEHVMGNNKSPYISTSSIFPEGSPRFDGKTIYIDVEKALKSGAKLVTTDEILKTLDEYKLHNPHLAKRVDKISSYVRDIDKEILVKGEKIPAKAIFTPESLTIVKNLSKVGRVVKVVGIALTAYDLEQATEKSVATKSVKPISAEVIRQAGGWGGFVAGAKIGTVSGAAVGIETGPGAFLTGLVGGIIFGAAGYYGADWVADYIDEN